MTGGHVGEPRSAVVQPCARCGARWAVQGKPLHWCPRCHGVLLSPAPVDAPPARRNYRWVARPPGRKAQHPARVDRGASTETPRYTQTPRWGLRDRAPQAAAVPVGRIDRLTARLPLLLILTAVAFGLSALAELGRYGILLRNRRRLIQPALLWVSDGTVTVFAALALVTALVTAVALVAWLMRTRAAMYGAVGRQDSRSPLELILGCLIPGANLLWPGVFLTEAVRVRDGGDVAQARLLRVVRIWWAGWVLNGVLVVVALLYRFAGSLQVRADGVLVTFWTDVVGAGVAVLTLWLVRAFAGRDLRGREHVVHRWVIATEPVTPVIEEVRPGAESDSAGRAPSAVVGNDEVPAPNSAAGTVSEQAREPEHEEVLAK